MYGFIKKQGLTTCNFIYPIRVSKDGWRESMDVILRALISSDDVLRIGFSYFNTVTDNDVQKTFKIPLEIIRKMFQSGIMSLEPSDIQLFVELMPYLPAPSSLNKMCSMYNELLFMPLDKQDEILSKVSECIIDSLSRDCVEAFKSVINDSANPTNYRILQLDNSEFQGFNHRNGNFLMDVRIR